VTVSCRQSYGRVVEDLSLLTVSLSRTVTGSKSMTGRLGQQRLGLQLGGMTILCVSSGVKRCARRAVRRSVRREAVVGEALVRSTRRASNAPAAVLRVHGQDERCRRALSCRFTCRRAGDGATKPTTALPSRSTKRVRDRTSDGRIAGARWWP